MTTRPTETGWADLTSSERRERRFASWLQAPGTNFVSTEAQAAYNGRVKRLVDAIKLQKPDRVPVTPFLGEFVATYAGYTQKEITYDTDKAIDAATRCTFELDFDANTPAGAPQGRIWEILENRQRNWPGGGLPDDGSPQFIEDEYMKADEYEAFTMDETDFRWRKYLPRIWGAAGGLAKMDMTGANIGQFGLPEVQTALHRLMEAGVEARESGARIAAANRKLTESGYPDFRSAGMFGIAPFDYLGDNLRGQRGIALDMYRQPERLLEAIIMFTNKRLHSIRQNAGNVAPGSSPIVGFPLHKGADGFMSDAQFRTFYWPSLRQIVLALIDEGFVPELRTQGSYDSRLEAILDLPRGTVIWHFYMTNIERARDAIGKTQCIVGSVPQSLLQVGTPEDVESYAKRIIGIAGKDGGFMLSSPGALGKEARTENVRALVAAAKKFGVY